MWVVWTNSQLATVFVSFFFLFCFLRLVYKSHWQINRYQFMLIRRLLCQECASYRGVLKFRNWVT